MDGTNVSGVVTVPNTGGWQTWQTVTVTTTSLTTGQKVMRIFADQGDFNLNYLEFSGSGNPAPTTSITSPANNASFTAPASITINANASDTAPGTVSSVAFYNGSTLLGTDTSSPYSFVWSNVAAGTYTLTTRATDNQGAVGTSAAITITVTGGSGCTGKPQYVENGGYVAGSQVQNSGSWYECKPYPFTGWCNGASWAYAPGSGLYWSDAWILKGSCSARSAQSEGDNNAFFEADGLGFYPNPAASGTENAVTFTFEQRQGKVKVNLKNVDGSDVFNQSFNNVEHSLKVQMPSLAHGMYLIRVQGENKSWIKKYIIK
jgi:hypothetical protein